MSLPFVLMVASYWLFLTGVVFIAGSFISRILVTAPSGADACLPEARKRSLGESAGRIIFWVALSSFVVSAIHAVFHASVMTETPINEVFSIMTLFLTKTKYGKFTLLRSVLVAVLIVVTFLGSRKSSRALDFIGAAISLTMLVTICMSGHKGAEGYFNIPFWTAVLHALSATIWIGGVFYIYLCYSLLIKRAGSELWEVLRAMMNRFSNLATVCVSIAVITGVALSFFSIEKLDQLTGTPYGISLMTKTLLVGIVMAMGAANKFYVVPRINRADTGRNEDLRYIRGRLSAFVAVEFYVGIGVLLATAVLSHLSPQG